MNRPAKTIAFDWHGESWTLRPTYEQEPHSGEYLLKPGTAETWTPMNLRCLFLHLGITSPDREPTLGTLASFFELTAKVTPEPLHTILHHANELRP